jgi:hypothetical protein
MSDKLQKLNPSTPAQITGTWDGARQWISSAGLFEQGKLFCQVMAGFELVELHKRHGVVNGSNQHQMRVSQDGKTSGIRGSGEKLNWDEVLAKETNLSSSTAYRFMDMAKAAAPRLKKIVALRGFDPLNKPMALLTAPQKQALQAGVRKLTDGKTQRDFCEDQGLWKKPQGSGATGRAPGEGGSRKLSLGERAELLKVQAVEDWAETADMLKVYRGKFTVLSDTSVEAQIAVLEKHLTARRAWLKQPKTNRVALAIEHLFDTKL